MESNGNNAPSNQNDPQAEGKDQDKNQKKDASDLGKKLHNMLLEAFPDKEEIINGRNPLPQFELMLQLIEDKFPTIEENSMDIVKEGKEESNSFDLDTLMLCVQRVIKVYSLQIVKKEGEINMGLLKLFNNILEKKEVKNPLVRKTIQIGILKILSKSLGGYSKIFKIDWEKLNINWIKDFNLINFVHLKLYPTYGTVEECKTMLNDFNILLQSFQNGTQPGDLINLMNAFLERYNFLYLYELLVNEFFNFGNQSNEKMELFKQILNVFYQSTFFTPLSNDLKNILGYFFNQLFDIKNPKFALFKCYIGIIIFYLVNENKTPNFYSSLLVNPSETLNESYIPGIEPNMDTEINSYYNLLGLFKEKFRHRYSPGIYLCSCGFMYLIGECSIPILEYTCPKCHETIGGLHHSILHRQNHFRLFENEAEKRAILGSWPGAYGDNWILFDDWKQPIIERINKDVKGIVGDTYENFRSNDKVVREIELETYRFLNCLMYGIISLIEESKEDDTVKKILYGQEKEKMFEECFKRLRRTLKKKKIENIFIFMNSILADTIGLFTTINFDMRDPNNRKIFEKELNDVIKKGEENYAENRKIYLNFKTQVEDPNELKMELNLPYGMIKNVFDLETYEKEGFTLIKYFN
ncbi:MAG: hypothetical protein MJ252_18130 [archaeon]|nr:hypothetical protein [archaeon]